MKSSVCMMLLRLDQSHMPESRSDSDKFIDGENDSNSMMSVITIRDDFFNHDNTLLEDLWVAWAFLAKSGP